MFQLDWIILHSGKRFLVSDENWYTLTNKYHLSHSTLHRLKHNKDVSTRTLNDLCRILHCDICDVVRYIPSEDDQTL